MVCKYIAEATDAVQAAFDLVLRRKALSAEAAAMQQIAILSGRYRHLAPQLEQLRQLDNQIASLAWNVPPPEQLTAYQTQLATLYHQRDELDRSLSREIPEMNLQKQLDTANRDAIAKALPDGATLVECVRFNVFSFKAIRAKGDSQWFPARYLAFILPANEPEQVKMIDLGEAEPIDNLIRVFRKSVSKGDRSLHLDSIPDEPEPIRPEVELRQKLIDPLKPYLKPQQQVFLAPDGELCCLPFGVLPTAEGRYLMEEYELCYLSVGRDLLRFGATQTLVQPTDSLVIADPDYNLSHSDLTPQQGSLQGKGEQEELPSPLRRGVGGEVSSDGAIYQQLHRDLGRGNGKVFKPIPATQIEGAQVAARLGVTPHMGTQALKSLVSHCQSPWILHIATHGYFLETRPETPPPQMMNFQRLHSAAQQNPLARSGLAFAGANTLLQGGNLPQKPKMDCLPPKEQVALTWQRQP
jgi:CHAT domain-containing protein